MKLTKRQKEVIKDLQKDFVICTNQSMSGAIIGSSDNEYKINSRTFWDLVDLKLIYQNCGKRGDCGYELTELGKEIKL